jgi:branched-chain amino acid transport system ATP-binding protein
VSPADVSQVLELRDVARHFGGIRAVDGVTLAIEEGAVVALIGPNGAGKSTLFALMMGELVPTAGEIRLDGLDMRGLSPERHSRLGIGRTFQAPRLFAGLSVAENVRIALLARAPESRRWGPSGWGVSRARASHPTPTHTPPPAQPHIRPSGQGHSHNAEPTNTPTPAQARISPPAQTHIPPATESPGEDELEAALAEVGLSGQRELAALSLSQGQRKRLELAMVLALGPRLLLLDEPTAGMGVEERATIMRLVMGAVRRRGLTLMFSEHDMETVFAHALRVVVMDRGTLIADGAPEEIRRDPHVQQIYLGSHMGVDAS